MEADVQSDTEDHFPVTHIVEVHDEDTSDELISTENILQMRSFDLGTTLDGFCCVGVLLFVLLSCADETSSQRGM